jgi:hypothetical protein
VDVWPAFTCWGESVNVLSETGMTVRSAVRFAARNEERFKRFCCDTEVCCVAFGY